MQVSSRIAGLYLVFQGVAGLIWWVLLFGSANVREVFAGTEAGWLAARTMVFADVIMFGFASIATGLLALRRHRFARAAGWATVGATAYATLAAVGWMLDPVGRWVGAVVMFASLIATVAAVASLR